jgi:hypothetical protein
MTYKRHHCAMPTRSPLASNNAGGGACSDNGGDARNNNGGDVRNNNGDARTRRKRLLLEQDHQ